MTKNVFVVATGPTGRFKSVNILATGPTGLAGPTGPAAPGISGPTGGFFPVWAQLTGPTGASGPTGTFKTVIDVGATGVKGLPTIIIPGYSRGGGGGAVTVWNPADQTGIAVSGLGRVATATAFNFNGIRSTTSKATGKVYFEVACSAAFSDGRSCLGFGLATSTLGQTNANAGFGGINEAGTNIQVAGFDPRTVALGAFPNKTYGVAIDIPNKLYWFTSDGVTWNAGAGASPGGTGGGTWTTQLPSALFIMASIIDSGAAMTLNTGQVAFAYSLPAGFTARG